MNRWIFSPACAALCASLALSAFDVAAAPPAPADEAISDEAVSDEAVSDEDRPAGDTPDYVVGEMLCARPC